MNINSLPQGAPNTPVINQKRPSRVTDFLTKLFKKETQSPQRRPLLSRRHSTGVDFSPRTPPPPTTISTNTLKQQLATELNTWAKTVKEEIILRKEAKNLPIKHEDLEKRANTIIEKVENVFTSYLSSEKTNEISFILCKMYTVPSFITHLKKVEVLDLRINKLKEVPEILKEMTALKKVDFSYNSIKVVPKFLLEMTSLEKLDISENPVEDFPNPEMIKGKKTVVLPKSFPKTHADLLKQLKKVAKVEIADDKFKE